MKLDKITHQVRIANWTKIIEQCNNRPKGMTVKQWLIDNDISDKCYYYWLRRIRQEVYSRTKESLPTALPSAGPPAVTFAEIPVSEPDYTGNSSFHADAMIQTRTMMIGISNTISESLLIKLMEMAGHAC